MCLHLKTELLRTTISIMKYYEAYKCGGNIVDITGGYYIYRIHTEKWYEDNHYYSKGDERIFGIYIDNYY